MNMISYWKNHREIYREETKYGKFVVIIGSYDHMNQNNGGRKALGVHWGNSPNSRGVLSPCVISEDTRNAILSGLLHKAITEKKLEQVTRLKEAIEFFVEE
jgi:hypothetical protein